MSKTIKNCFDEKLNFINLYDAFYRICSEDRNKEYILKAEINIETIICNLEEDLRNGTYKPGEYRVFTIYEPKERVIMALPFRDRIVHQWYVEEFIKPYFLKRFIKDSYACIPTKGVHIASYNLQRYMRKMEINYGDYFILKCDIEKFFYNIDKTVLFGILEDKISDKKVLNLSRVILDDLEGKGIPIGNYTSQFFANIYLNELDMFIKHNLRVKYYVRYMDDFVLLLRNREECKVIRDRISEFLGSRLKLRLNRKTCYFPSVCGVNFCGYRIYSTHILVMGSNKNKMKKRIGKWNNMYLNNELDYGMVRNSYNSWLGHISHVNGYNLRKRMSDRMLFKKEMEDLYGKREDY